MTNREIKAFKTPVSIIENISKLGWGVLKSKPLLGVKARMRKSEKHFLINWTSPGQSERVSPDSHYQDLRFDFKGYSIVLEQVFDKSNNLIWLKGVRTTENVDFFYTAGFEKKVAYYYRLLIPLERKMNSLFQLARKSFIDDYGMGYAQGTKATINGDELQISVFHDKKGKNYLAIDSTAQQPFENFSDKAHAVINGLGFLSGYLVGNEGWYFVY